MLNTCALELKVDGINVFFTNERTKTIAATMTTATTKNNYNRKTNLLSRFSIAFRHGFYLMVLGHRFHFVFAHNNFSTELNRHFGTTNKFQTEIRLLVKSAKAIIT